MEVRSTLLPSLPPQETVYSAFGSDLSKIWIARSYPNPNEDGSPGTLANLTGAQFHGDLRDSYDNLFIIDTGVFNLGSYIVGTTGGRAILTVPQATLEQIPVGTHRYKVAMSLSSGPYLPFRFGPFLVNGPCEFAAYVMIASGDVPTDTGPFTIYGELASPSDRTATVMNDVRRAYVLTGFAGVKVFTGGLTMTVTLNGSPIGGMSNIVVTGSPQDIAPTGGTLSIAVNDVLEVIMSSTQGGTTRLVFALTGTR